MSGGDKAEIRRQMRRLRRDLSEEEQQRAADGVYAQIMRMESYRTARTVMAYAAVRGELSMRRIMEDIRASGRLLALPRCGESGDMDAFIVTEQRQLRRGAYGIWEPDESCPIVPPDAIDLMLIPGTAFDRAGGRIGQGGGYYDRYILKTRAFRVGVCHGFALMDSVPTEKHDARMDAVVTPEETLIFRQEERT